MQVKHFLSGRIRKQYTIQHWYVRCLNSSVFTFCSVGVKKKKTSISFKNMCIMVIMKYGMGKEKLEDENDIKITFVT